MFLSIYLIGYCKLAEVRTRDEAFSEMRRYMQINNIYSDVTVLSSADFVDSQGVSETVSLVRMRSQSGSDRDELVFAIHDKTRPNYESITDAVQRSSCFAYCYNDYKTNGDRTHSNRLHCLRYASNRIDSLYYSWFPDEYDRYISDLQQRAGDVCL